jgi:hypothetical protein
MLLCRNVEIKNSFRIQLFSVTEEPRSKQRQFQLSIYNSSVG